MSHNSSVCGKIEVGPPPIYSVRYNHIVHSSLGFTLGFCANRLLWTSGMRSRKPLLSAQSFPRTGPAAKLVCWIMSIKIKYASLTSKAPRGYNVLDAGVTHKPLWVGWGKVTGFLDYSLFLSASLQISKVVLDKFNNEPCFVKYYCVMTHL